MSLTQIHVFTDPATDLEDALTEALEPFYADLDDLEDAQHPAKWTSWVIGARDCRLAGGDGTTAAVGDLNPATARAVAREQAASVYDEFLAATEGMDTGQTFASVMAELDAGLFDSTGEARDYFWGQPWVTVARSHMARNVGDTPHDYFLIGQGGRDAFLAREIAVDVPDEFLDLDGNWWETPPAVSESTAGAERDRFVARYRAYLATVDPRTRVTAVTLHG